MVLIEDLNWTDCVSFTSTWPIKRRSIPTDDSSPAEPPLPAITADAVVFGVGGGWDASDPDALNSAAVDGAAGVLLVAAVGSGTWSSMPASHGDGAHIIPESGAGAGPRLVYHRRLVPCPLLPLVPDVEVDGLEVLE